MTASASRSRQPKGIATGGQFAAEHKSEAAGVTLSTTAEDPYAQGFSSPAFLQAAVRRQEAVELHTYMEAVRQAHPDATAFRPLPGTVQVTWCGVTGEGGEIVDESIATPYPAEASTAIRACTSDDGWIEMVHVWDHHHATGREYDQAVASASQERTVSPEKTIYYQEEPSRGDAVEALLTGAISHRRAAAARASRTTL